MILPAAFALALWGTHFLRGTVSADELIDHCGPDAPALLAPFRGKVNQIGLAVVAPGDFSGIQTAQREVVLGHRSVAIINGELFSPFDLSRIEGSVRTIPSRSEAERLLASALVAAHEHFVESPVFGASAPTIPEIEFPYEHPAKLRELITRAIATATIAEAVTSTWHTDKASHHKTSEVVREMLFASRRGLEAGVLL